MLPRIFSWTGVSKLLSTRNTCAKPLCSDFGSCNSCYSIITITFLGLWSFMHFALLPYCFRKLRVDIFRLITMITLNKKLPKKLFWPLIHPYSSPPRPPSSFRHVMKDQSIIFRGMVNTTTTEQNVSAPGFQRTFMPIKSFPILFFTMINRLVLEIRTLKNELNLVIRLGSQTFMYNFRIRTIPESRAVCHQSWVVYTYGLSLFACVIRLSYFDLSWNVPLMSRYPAIQGFLSWWPHPLAKLILISFQINPYIPGVISTYPEMERLKSLLKWHHGESLTNPWKLASSRTFAMICACVINIFVPLLLAFSVMYTVHVQKRLLDSHMYSCSSGVASRSGVAICVFLFCWKPWGYKLPLHIIDSAHPWENQLRSGQRQFSLGAEPLRCSLPIAFVLCLVAIAREQPCPLRGRSHVHSSTAPSLINGCYRKRTDTGLVLAAGIKAAQTEESLKW